MMIFLYPWMFLLLLLPFVWRFLSKPAQGLWGAALKVPFVEDLLNITNKNTSLSAPSKASNGKARLLYLSLIWLLFTIAAARPVVLGNPIRLPQQARDILLVTDISTSMLEQDFSYQGSRISRLAAVRAVVSDFVKKRAQDRLGLVLFGTRAYLQAPLTYDHQAVLEVLDSMSAGMAGNSTAIGDAVGMALKALKDTGGNLNDKIIILLTDGQNNDGSLNMEQALALAKEEGAKVYTVSVGTDGFSLFNSFLGIHDGMAQNEELAALSAQTSGKAFQADSLQALADVYKTIDALEPAQKDETFVRPQTDFYWVPLLAALIGAFLGLFGTRRF